MLRELACQFPRMQAALIGMNEAAREAHSNGLASDRIYPPAAFDDRTRQEREDALRDTRYAQPAIGAVSRGLLGILDDFGVRPDMVGGHSFGELTALRAAGRIGDATLGMLAHRRGALMADCAAGGSGAMLAAFAPIEQVAASIRDHALDVVIANKNAPRQCVLSGPTVEIERTREALADRGIATRPVPVSAAFHSRFVSGAREPFRRTLDLVEIAPSAIPVFANATAAPYPDDARAARDLLADQLARPVEFVAQVEAMFAMGARTFLEVGPDARLTGLVRSILEGRDHTAIAADASRGSEGNVLDLACSLATLAALGYAVDLTLWDDGSAARGEPAKKPGLTVRITGCPPAPDQHPGRRSAIVERSRPGGVASDRTGPVRAPSATVLAARCPGNDDAPPPPATRSRRERPNDESSRTAEFPPAREWPAPRRDRIPPRSRGGEWNAGAPAVRAAIRVVDRRLAGLPHGAREFVRTPPHGRAHGRPAPAVPRGPGEDPAGVAEVAGAAAATGHAAYPGRR